MPTVIIFAGCIIPDVPWILQRVYSSLGLGSESHLSSAFFLAQASLAMCLLPSIALGCVFRRWRLATLVAWIGCALHLLLDSAQSKWGNGVHLLAPFDWTMFRMETPQTDLSVLPWLTIAGLIPFFLLGKAREDAKAICINRRRAAIAAALLVPYMVLPIYAIDGVVESDSRHLKALSEPQNSIGSLIELDRETLTVSAAGAEISTHVGNTLEIVDVPESVGAGIYSVRGELVSGTSIRLTDWKHHAANRDMPSYVGLVLITTWVAHVLLLYRRTRREGVRY